MSVSWTYHILLFNPFQIGDTTCRANTAFCLFLQMQWGRDGFKASSPVSSAELNMCGREECSIKLQIFLVWPFTTPSTPAFLPMSCKLWEKSASSDWVSDSAAKQSRNTMLLSKHTVCYECVVWPSPINHWDGTGCQQNTWAGKTVSKFNSLGTVSASSLLKKKK